MCDKEKIRQALMEQLRQQKSQPNREEGAQSAAMRLATLLTTQCEQRHWSADDLARRLEIESELAEALLQGLLPCSEIDDDFLDDISHAIGYHPVELRILLNRDSSS